MTNHHDLISDAFMTFSTQAPNHAKAWMTLVQSLTEACSLDPKTRELAFIAVLAALGRQEGIPFHVTQATELGASREDVLSAILVGLPAAGHVVTQALPAAQKVLDTATQGA